MNRAELDILNSLKREPFVNQRRLAASSGVSLGLVNRGVRNLIDAGYLSENMGITDKAEEEIHAKSPRNAIILAAGVGMRMVPINHLQPKGMIEVDGEPLVERLVRQLREAGVTDITIVVGFMKERFEYLIDEYGVFLVVNREYASKNNLHTLALASDRLSNTYIVPSDVWCARNPFCANELYSWYMVSDSVDDGSYVRISRRGELARVRRGSGGNGMVGISYLLDAGSKILRERLTAMDADPAFDACFWEDALFTRDCIPVMAKPVHASDVVEIDTYEQLREIDERSDQLKSNAIEYISSVLEVPASRVKDIVVLKRGVVNRSFRFSVGSDKYVMRVPVKGTNRLIDRFQEARAYDAISGRGLCDDPVSLDPGRGYKITRFLSGTRKCDAKSESDLRRCMNKLRELHGMGLEVEHTFDIFERIDFYESLWEGTPSEYRDYARTKSNVFSLRPYVESLPHDWCLTHVDAVPDNFLFYSDGMGGETLQLTDWEYAGMQDPHVDIAMFAIYSLYTRDQIDWLIDIYFLDEGGCEIAVRTKIYCYIAMCGLLWSNWCEYKRNLGVEFGEYSLAQYRYAKDYYRFATELMSTMQVRSEIVQSR